MRRQVARRSEVINARYDTLPNCPAPNTIDDHARGQRFVSLVIHLASSKRPLVVGVQQSWPPWRKTPVDLAVLSRPLFNLAAFPTVAVVNDHHLSVSAPGRCGMRGRSIPAKPIGPIARIHARKKLPGNGRPPGPRCRAARLAESKLRGLSSTPMAKAFIEPSSL